MTADAVDPIYLEPGWNFFGNPFFYNICWDSVLAYSGITTDLVEIPQVYDGDFIETNLIEPWKGYAVLNNSETTLPLVFPAKESNCGQSTIFNDGPFEWLIEMSLATENGNDGHNYLGVLSDSDPALKKKLTLSKPPLVAKKAQLAFADDKSTDIRLDSDEQSDWHLEVSADSEEATLAWKMLVDLPDDREVYLINELTSEYINMKTASGYQFAANGHVQQLRVVVGLSNELRDLLIPGQYFLGQNYPNPFNPSTKILYGLTRQSKTKVSVYSVTGQLVRTLVDELQTAGHYTVVWDGTNNDGLRVSSGVYFYDLEIAGTEKQRRRMVLLK